ncbi:uncharacterized protein LOC123923522 [Trifolium pratense]|uniref:uncharacterized protein LOC123909083 n=1 Tax=Trifolium pratense TaxID=57577 RepID=UPI001E690CCA|nr:uncharacterized protein LOC123909083 [Trifolium pratense]XP_045832167.1 uncharacterized protein LOC123923522 [Trifolium pratense]
MSTVPLSNGVRGLPVWVWQQTIKKHEGDGYGVIEFPEFVAMHFLTKEPRPITLIDEENSQSYECQIEIVNDGSNNKYIVKGWFKYLEEVGLDDGERVLIQVEKPPNKMYVYRLIGLY